MAKKDTEILQEVINRLSELEEKVSSLEKEMAILKGMPETMDMEPVRDDEAIDLSLDVDMPQEIPATVTLPEEDVPEAEAVPVMPDEPEDLPDEVYDTAMDIPEAEEVTEIEKVPEAESVAEEETPETEAVPEAEESGLPAEDLPEDLPTDIFGEERPEPEETKKGRKKILIDAMSEKSAWLHDIPGPEVKSIRSAIGLGDQMIYIRRLFRDDPVLYRDTLGKLDASAKLDDAVEYLKKTFPEWNFDDEDVYRFMMSVRRKIRK